MNTLGERILFCRSLLDLTRPELIKDLKIVSESTYARWELGTIKIPEKRILQLVDYYSSKGMIVASEWLRYGTGNIPFFITDNFINKVNFDEIAFLTAEKLKTKIDKFIYFQINNTFYDPVINYGDYVGGIQREDIKLLDAKLCFFKNNDGILVGIFHYSSKNKGRITNCSNISKEIIITQGTIMGGVNWIMKRFD